MNSSSPIIITGFMASGKTTVARVLARILQREMLDLDQVVADREGRTAQEIIEQDGEQSFREIETARLLEVLETSLPGVIALGGGAWTLPRNRKLINDHNGLTVWLDAPFELCWARISRVGSGRPLARDEAEARRLYAERTPLYALATLRMEVEAHQTADKISAEIAQTLEDLYNSKFK